MADKSFGVKELNLLNASGTPTVTSPNNLNLNANTVAISTSCTIGNNLTVTSTTNSANLNVTGIGTLTRGFATDLSVSGISTISQPSNANPHSLWDVVNNGASAYRFTGPGQDGAEDNPNIYLVRGQRYIFKVNASGHPFQLRVANGGAAYSDGVTNNGAQSGNVVINVQHDAPAQLYYQCTSHGSMVGNIYIVGGPQVISGVVTATTFVGNLTGNPTGSGANLTNLPAANLTGTLPAISGANLTNLPAQATIANNGNDRIITGGSGVNLNGEANLQFDGTDLYVSDNIKHLGDPDTLIQFTTDTIDLTTAGSSRIRITSDGKIGFHASSPVTRFQIGNATFNGGHGMYSNDRVGMANHGSLTGLMLASTYNDAGVPEYGLVFVQGPTTSNYNCWSLSPDGPAKGNSLSLHYGAQNTNIHILSNRKFEFDGDGDFNIINGNLNASAGVGTFSGSVTVGYDTTYSPIQQAASTYFYTRADQASSVSGSNIQNLATGSLKISETIPISNMTRQSDAGAHSFYNSSATSGSVTRNMSSGNPFHPKAYGLTMGTMFRAHTSGNNGSGVIHYGWTPTNHHFFVRYKYNNVSLQIGADTNGSDVWTTIYQNDLLSDSNWYFLVVAVERNGTLLTSLNGAPLTPVRMMGTAPAPTDARFGLAGDGYADNDSRHRYATAFWYRGVMSSELIAQEYAWLKTIWTGASLP